MKDVTNHGAATLEFFGVDPSPGILKTCQVLISDQTKAENWEKIGEEGDSLVINGTQIVRFGKGNNWIVKLLSGSIKCTRDFFGGDPLPHVRKICETLKPEGPQGTWKSITKEGGHFSVDGVQTYRYGKNIHWITKVMKGTCIADNKTFGGDPVPGEKKECQLWIPVKVTSSGQAQVNDHFPFIIPHPHHPLPAESLKKDNEIPTENKTKEENNKKLNDSSNYLDEFHRKAMDRASETGCGVVNDNTLYYFVPGGNHDLKYLTVQLSDLQSQDKRDLKSIGVSKNWQKTMLSNIIKKGEKRSGAKLKSKKRPAAVSLNGKVYFFWVDSKDRNVFMTDIDPQKENSESSAYKILLKTKGAQLETDSYLSANTTPDGNKIVLNYMDLEKKKDRMTRCLLSTLVLDPDDIINITDNHSWEGTPAGQDIDTISLKLDLDDSYDAISTTWFSAGSGKNFMVASFYSSEYNNLKFLTYLINQDGTPDLKSSAGKDTTPKTISMLDNVSRGFTLSRDPAGRILGIYCDKEKENHLFWRILPTAITSTKIVIPNLRWEKGIDLNGEGHDSRKCPAAVFVNGEMDSNKSFPWYLFAFYACNNEGDDGYDIKVQVSGYGESRIATGENKFEYDKNEKEGNGVLGLIMESFPFPIENLPKHCSSEGTVFTYSMTTENTSSESLETSYDVRFGMKSSLEVTAGSGPCFESEFKTGPSGQYTSTSAYTITQEYTTNTDYSVASDGSPKIIPKATYFYTGYPILSEDLSKFYEEKKFFPNATGDTVSGRSAPLYAVVYPIKGDDGNDVKTGNFSTYAFIPGDITSYTEAAVNKRMKMLFDRLTRDQQKKLLSNDYKPDDYSNYFDRVIKPNIQKLGNDDYLPISYGPTSSGTKTFNEVNSTMAFNAFTCEGYVYAGASVGFESAFLGTTTVGSKATFQYGMEFSSSIGVREEKGEAWGIQVDPSIPPGVEDAKNVSVRLYYLKPNQLWAREVQAFGGDVKGFDSSKPSRFFFLVND